MPKRGLKAAIICPVFNASSHAKEWVQSFDRQDNCPSLRLIVDSSSDDEVVSIFQASGFKVKKIDQSTFDHARTRQMAAEMMNDADVLIYCTQDAFFADEHAIENILKPFDDPDVAAVCGRQLPHDDATHIARHARTFNYSDKSEVRSKGDIPRLGIKTAFLSNSFAAYRRSHLMEVGGFKGPSIHAEDMAVAARFIMAGYKIAYAADACVKHSHNYSIPEESRRYFDTGVFHSRNPWIKDTFGGTGGEGLRFAISELKYVSRKAPWLLPTLPFRTLSKFLAFELGKHERYLPCAIKRSLSMNKTFWNR